MLLEPTPGPFVLPIMGIPPSLDISLTLISQNRNQIGVSSICLYGRCVFPVSSWSVFHYVPFILCLSWCMLSGKQSSSKPSGRFSVGIVAAEDLHLFQLDVNTVFLHGNNEEEEIYMVQPEGFETRGKEGHIWLLKKSLYGLRGSGQRNSTSSWSIDTFPSLLWGQMSLPLFLQLP
uniref:Reverse transcriptase Ty1/copia-type domain-containing protein n=1 Tax=Cynodon dactylon x Cynodon transvaalensis TaxID=1920021 RepID=A0A5J6YDF2_9POAL|nr:hypothetical protein [Cynodon dactylon x Cynodon transvaalensis]